MCDSEKLHPSEDDEDLESLRLAALQSIKRKMLIQMKNVCDIGQVCKIRGEDSLDHIKEEQEKCFTGGREETKLNVGGTALTLPQDRYCGKEKTEEKCVEGTSKFTRYDKSDKSESESEEEEEADSSDGGSPGKLKKSDSLEALMEELDAEIQGKTVTKEVKDVKPKRKIKKKIQTSSETVSTSDSDAKPNEQKEEKLESSKTVDIKKTENEASVSQPEKMEVRVDDKTNEQVQNKSKFDDFYGPLTKRRRSRSPMNRRRGNFRRRGTFQKFTSQPPPHLPFIPPPPQYNMQMMPFPNQPFNPMFCPPNVGIMNQPPPFFERPVSPLAINTESLTTATLAPLSPRSAAFVLENKAIIERRKRSPRRSYSRSPSLSPRRSLTPRRSPRRSITPRRISRSPRRLSRSPLRRRSPSPRRRSLSPRRKNVSRNADTSPKSKPTVRDRLGVKSNKTEDNKDKPEESSPKKDEKPVDPVLEARRKKFESNEIKKKEGIIRLKPKEDKPKEPSPPLAMSTPSQTEVSVPAPEQETKVKEEIKPDPPKDMDVFEELEKLLNEKDVLLEGDDIELDPKVSDIFSDEESGSDNEGRFKVKEQTSKKPPILPFTKLMNGAKRATKRSYQIPWIREGIETVINTKRGGPELEHPTTGTSKENTKEDDRRASTAKKSESQEKAAAKNRKSERHVASVEKRFERKIEIKIKNPSKYERGGKSKYSKDGDKSMEKVKRKVEVGKKGEEEDDDEIEPEMVVENDSGDEENSAVSEGDLRAQLSKKRAEKLHRIPIEGVSSRLLQSALQGAVFRERKKKSKEQDITSSDGKLPVYLRLGIANNSDIFTETKVKKKSRKRKNREVLEQV
ncbi:hypothetical protein NQ317_011859 [Molorchus minor]|uniref:Uncharacterized protein n=1 Tax=Molorchus minor TaxID=1323400 RepID=A0ABQ9JPQ1_9CUCU|nr:hypothetical protein NQ317_011859 [Molorchus minor]